MIRIATVADQRFRSRASHLATSLERSGNEYRLTVYCDDAEFFGSLRSRHCELVEIAEMRRLGAKRAKFTAFAAALREGSVIYLDADAIVLESLDELWGGTKIKGVAMDLREHPLEGDPVRPWARDPTLINRCYIMSGAFFAPASAYSFFERIRLASLDEQTWRKYTDTWLDQRFLNAFINLHNQPVDFVDPEVYGWESLLKNRKVQVYRSGSQLVNTHTNKTVRMVLFGGIQQTAEVLCSLPLEVAALLFERITPGNPSIGTGLAQLYAALSPFLTGEAEDPLPREILGTVLAEIPGLADICSGKPAGVVSYFLNPEAMKAMAFATPPRDHRWNGLPCGGSHLDGDEYHWVRRITQEMGIRTVLETGVMASSGVFREIGLTRFCLDYERRPGTARAVELGGTLLLVPFDHEQNRFEENELRAQVAAHNLSGIDLLFVNWLRGPAIPRGVLQQLVTCVRPRLIVYPNALKDSTGLLRDQAELGLRLVKFFESARGIALFENQDWRGPATVRGADSATVVRSAKVSISSSSPICFAPDRTSTVRVKLRNSSDIVLSSGHVYPVHVSYHWLAPDGEMVVFEGQRTRLPFDIEPGDVAEFAVDVTGPELEGDYLLQIAVVQERICWFEQLDPESLCTVATSVRDLIP